MLRCAGSDTLRGDPRHAVTRVYGHRLVEPDGAGNPQILHCGGHSDDLRLDRKGRRELHHTTVISQRVGSTTLVRLSTGEQSADIRNSVVVAAGGVAITAATGGVERAHSWLPEGWRDTFEAGFAATLEDRDKDVGTDPEHRRGPGLDAGQESTRARSRRGLSRLAGSPLLNAPGPLSEASEDWPADPEHSPGGTAPAWADDGTPDIGAFEG